MNKIYRILLILCLLETLTVGQNFAVNLSDFLLLNQNYSGITNIGWDFSGNFLVGFLDGTARKYTNNFSSYTQFYVPEVIDYFRTRYVANITTTLSNGTIISFTSYKTVITTNNYRRVRDYNYVTYIQEEVYSLNQTYITQLSFAYIVAGVSYTYHLLVCNTSVVLAFRGIVTTYNYTTIFGSPSNCIAATVYNNNYNSSTNQVIATIVFYLSLGTKVHKMTTTVTFTYNSTINHFDAAASFTQNLIFTSTNLITSMFADNWVLMMQSNSSWQTYIYDMSASLMGTNVGIPAEQIFNFFYVYNAFYLLQSTGLAKFNYRLSNRTLSFSLKTSNLPVNTYNLMLGEPTNPFYVPGAPYIYKSGMCSGQTTKVGTSCVSYNCTTANCAFCPISSFICSVCSTGFILDVNYLCQINNTNTSTSNNTANATTNTTNNSTTANSTTSNTTTTNSTTTNTTANNSTSTNSTTNNSTNNSTITPILNNNTTQIVIWNQLDFFSFFQQILQYLLNLLQILISIPAARRVASPIFYYFGIFDDLYLYQFHDRIYGDTMNSIFMNINSIQSQKWSILNYHTTINWFGVDQNSFQNITNYQDAYNIYNFTDANHTDVGSEGIWANCQNFFIVSLPITIIGFLFGKIMFKILFNFIISKFFRRFDFWCLLFLLLFDGNIQQFSFYLATDWKNMFFFNLSSKIVKFQVIIFGFAIVIISTALYFLSYSFYSKLNKHIMDNNKNIIHGHSSLIVQFGLRNLFLGIMHSSLRTFQYKSMLTVLLLSQIVFIIFFVRSISMNIYEYNLKIWIYVLLNFAKVLLMVTLFIDIQNINIPIIQATQQLLMTVLIMIFILGCLVEAYLSLKDITQFIQIIMKYYAQKGKKYNKKCLEGQIKKGNVAFNVSNILKQQQSHVVLNQRSKTNFCTPNSHFQTQKNIEKEVFSQRKIKAKQNGSNKFYLKVQFKDVEV